MTHRKTPRPLDIPSKSKSAYPGMAQLVADNDTIVYQVGPNDVLLGRGPSVYSNPGNVAFRRYCSSRGDEYQESNWKEKRRIANQVIDHVRCQLDPPGRFLCKVEPAKAQAPGGTVSASGEHAWRHADISAALEKAKQTMRDAGRGQHSAKNGPDKRTKAEKETSVDGDSQPKRVSSSSPPSPCAESPASSTLDNDKDVRVSCHRLDGSIDEAIHLMEFEPDDFPFDVTAELSQEHADTMLGGLNVTDASSDADSVSSAQQQQSTTKVETDSDVPINYFRKIQAAQQNKEGSSDRKGGRILLFTPHDYQSLSPSLCFIRAQLEIFEATKEDVARRQRKGGKAPNIEIGQVGIRCIHCAHVPLGDRKKASEKYPGSIRLVHQAVRNWQRHHFHACENITQELREKFESFKEGKNYSNGIGLKYWVESCGRRGMVDKRGDKDGIWLHKKKQDQPVTLAEPPVILSMTSEASACPADVQLEAEGESNGPELDEDVRQQTGVLMNANVLPTHDSDSKPRASTEEQVKRDYLRERVRFAHAIVTSIGEMGHFPFSDEMSHHRGQIQDEMPEELLSIGIGLYDWFAGCHPFGDSSSSNENSLPGPNGPPAPTSITNGPRKRRDMGSPNKAYTPLRELGFPVSLCSLVSRLFDADNVDHYESAGEVEEDLRLMIADPDRFLFDASLETMSGKLEFPRDRLYGREKEVASLLDSYDRAIESNGSCEVVMVSGASGTGKSSLVQLVQGLLEGKAGYFISGKFDKLQQVQPLSAIATAFNEYCDIILTRDADTIHQMKTAIESAIGSDGQVLTNLIPNLERIIGQAPDTSVTFSGKESQNRLVFLFRVFVRTIATPSHPLIIFLDDLQWADEASLELMRMLVVDPGVTSLLFLGSYRDNEVDIDHALTVQLRSIECLGISVSSIRIDSIDKDSVNALISDTLRLLPRLTLPLADAVFRKTGGNGLFVVQFLKSLCDEGLLRFSFSSRRWEWDLEGIQSKAIADNVAELMTSKMQKLGPGIQWVLKAAACLGSRTEALTLKLLNADDGASLFHCLDTAVSEGLMFKTGSAYKFSHDQIQQAAYSLIPVMERDASHLRVGRLLWKNATVEELDQIIFSVVDQLRRGSDLISDRGEKVDVARLCLLAGEKAMSKSAFSPASIYLLQGTALLDELNWGDNYDMSLRLFSCCVEAQYATGNYDGVMITSQPILVRGKCLHDKLRAYYALLNSLGSQGKQLDVIQLGLKVLAELGESFPKEIERRDVLEDFAKTRAMLERTTTSGILQMNVMEDSKIVAVMTILNISTRYAYQVNQQLMSLMAFRMVQLSLCHGVCRESSFAFSAFGVVLCAFGELEEGYLNGKLALSLIERFKAKEHLARVYAVVYGLINTFKDPMQACLPSLKQGYEIGMSTGDNEWAFANATAYIIYSIQSGCNLEELAEAARAYMQQMKEYNHQILTITLPYYQTILNLMGKSDDPTELTGEAMNQDELLHMALEKGLLNVAMMIYFFRTWLAYLYRRYDLAAEMIERRREIDKARPLRPETTANEVFYTGLFAAVIARESEQESEQSEWRIVALESADKMTILAANSTWNFQHKLHLLQAEIAYLNSDLDGAAKAYDHAIRVAGVHGFIHEQALACERAGIFYSKEVSPATATDYFKRSRVYYAQWGAKSKADDVLQFLA